MAISAERMQMQRALRRGPKENPRFLPRLDGTYDYFPDGQDRPGYRLTERNRQWIVEIERAFLLQTLVGFAAVAAAVYFGAQYIDDRQPGLSIYADSWVLRLGVAVLAAALVYRFLSKIRRSQIHRLTEQAPPERPRAATSDAGSHFARRWVEMSIGRRLIILVGAPVLTLFLVFDAIARLAATDPVALYEAIVLGGFGAAIGLGYVFLLAKLIRSNPGG
jgi:hypothetical protein